MPATTLEELAAMMVAADLARIGVGGDRPTARTAARQAVASVAAE
jgi:hypothetical protein